MSDKEIFAVALADVSKIFLPSYQSQNIDQTSQDLVNYFIDNFKKTGLKRIGKGLAATAIFAVGDYVFGREGNSTLENICKIGEFGSAFVTLSATRALISAYWNKDFLKEIAPYIVRKYYLVDKK